MKPLSFFTALFVCLALLLASLYTVAIDPRTYARQQARLNVAERSGFSQEELLALDTAVARYMRGAGTLDEAVFSPREIAHMRDVRALMALCERVLALLAALAALGLALVFSRLRLNGLSRAAAATGAGRCWRWRRASRFWRRGLLSISPACSRPSTNCCSPTICGCSARPPR